jgi:dsRNA-specific ribonuclease
MKRKNEKFWRGVAISELILFMVAITVMSPILKFKKKIKCDVFEATTAAMITTMTPKVTTTTENFKTTAIKSKTEDTTALNAFTETTQQLEQPV